MEEQKKAQLQRELKKAIEKRKKLNGVVVENDAQKVIEKITKIIEKLNSDKCYQKESIPYIEVARSNADILIKSNRDLSDITDSLGEYGNATWKEVKEFLCDTFGAQQSEDSYIIPFGE